MQTEVVLIRLQLLWTIPRRVSLSSSSFQCLPFQRAVRAALSTWTCRLWQPLRQTDRQTD